MISTGAFQSEVDSSEKQNTYVNKMVKAWEKKNAKLARAGGVSLMALSLAACGSDDAATTTTTADTTTVTPVTPVVVTNAAQSLVKAVNDALVGDGGNDTFNGDAGTMVAADVIADSSTTDADVANLTNTAALPALSVKNVETVNVNLNNVGDVAADVTNMSGVSNLVVTRGDITIGGSTITGDKTVNVDGLNTANIAKVTTGAGTKAVDIAMVTTAGVVVDADTATGAITVHGATTLTANASLGKIDIENMAIANTTQDALATSVTANATTVEVETDALLTGAITINAAKAKIIDVKNATGGVEINAEAGATTGITVVDIDASGATINTGSYATTAGGTITIDGTAAATDTATINAEGTIALDIDGSNAGNVDVLNLTGDSAVTYTIATPNTGTYTTGTIDANTTAKGNESVFAGTTTTGSGTLHFSAGTADAVALSNVDVGKIIIGFDNNNDATNEDHNFTVPSGSTLELQKDQSNFSVSFSAASTAGDLKIIAGDDNGALNSAVGTITTGVLAADAAATVAGTVTIEAIDANLTATTSTTLGAKQALVVTGDEDVTLATVTAASLDASASTGKISMTATTGVKSVTTGSGIDTLTFNGAAVHVVASGAGNDSITITNTAATASFDAGAGNDTINANKAAAAYVVVAGDGDDTVTTTGDIDVVMAGGTGTDTFDANNNGAFDASNNTSFALAGFEKLDIVGVNDTMTVSAAQFANFNTVEVNGDAAADILKVTAAATGSTIDASGLTVKTGGTVTLQYAGAAGVDTITGGVAAETFLHSLGGDNIEGGSTGTDTFSIADSTVTEVGSTDASSGAVINLSAAAVSAVTIYAAGSQYTGNGSAVAAGTTSYVYAANKTTNSTIATTLGGIENVTGGDGKDYIVGTAGANSLDGGAAADVILGGDGADTITGGGGADTITTGNGADTIVHAASSGVDTITDFTAGAGGDVFDATGFEAITTQDVNFLLAAANATIDVGTTAGIIAINADVAGAATLTAANLNTALTGTTSGAANGEKAIFAVSTDVDSATVDVHLFIAEHDGTDFDGTTHLATLTNVQLDALTAANFDGYA